MNTRIALSTAAVLLLAACGGGQQPSRDDGPNPRPMTARDSAQRQLFEAYRGAQMPSVPALIGARERLKLTSAQVTAIDSIAEAVRIQNRPLTDSLRSVSGSGNGGPIRQPRGEFQTARFVPMLHRIADNNRRAMEAIGAQLTAEQKADVCVLAREQRQGRYGGMGGRGRGARGGGGFGGGRGGMRGDMPAMNGDSIRGPDGRYLGRAGGWPWCAAPFRDIRTDSTKMAPPARRP